MSDKRILVLSKAGVGTMMSSPGIRALNIARVCAELDARCVYISTDYIFDGSKGAPYVESDPSCPINVYGASKLAGEFLVRQTALRWLIVKRWSWAAASSRDMAS